VTDLDLSIADAADRIARGGLVAYPTETVWGLAADARSDAAVDRLRAFKGRGPAPISILVADAAALEALGFRPGAAARQLAATFWPGPLTLVLPCLEPFASGIARDDGAVGVRCSSHPLARALAEQCARAGVGPLTATSCNATGEAAARTREEAHRVCDAAAVGLLAGSPDAGGEPESTVVDLCGARPRVLRWGGVPKSVLAPLLEELAAA
jgi:L-threonylcarbamoyladenylate synthase